MTDISSRSSDPVFANLRNKGCEDKHALADIKKKKKKNEALQHPGICTWPGRCVNLYLTNYVAGKETTKAVEKVNSKEFIIRDEDSSKIRKQVLVR